MLVSSIYSQCAEVTGLCDQSLNFQAMSRAVELLANEGLFDPLIGYLNFSNSQTNLVTLPREVKTVLRVNINKTPTFFHNRLWEFTLNTNGSVDGEEVGFTWADKGYSPVQDERKLPGHLAYVCEKVGDLGKTCTIFGRDVNGKEITEVLVAVSSATGHYSTQAFFQIDKVIRDTTEGVCLVWIDNLNPQIIAQYYPDETDPMYRVIKLSKAVADIRIMFRRDVYEIKSMDDVIPIQSKMAMICATQAVRNMANDNYEGAMAKLQMAVDFVKKEQASRDEGDQIASQMEQPGMIDASINVRDGIIVADVYDVACTIFGFIGRAKIFDKITTAIEVLRNLAHWDAGLGVVDIWMPDRTEEINIRNGKGTGYFVLPRFVEAVVSLNLCGHPSMARNRWFEFHLNGTGENSRASGMSWDDAGETCIIQELENSPVTHRVYPVKIVAVPSNALDNNKIVTVYGTELDSSGREVEVMRNGAYGWKVPCVVGSLNPGTNAPAFTSIHRIVRDATTDFVRLYTVAFTADSITHPARLLGLWYPDEIEPKYRAIRTSTAKGSRIRVLYRRRTKKVTSLFEPIPLRSRLAIENMLRSLKAAETDPAAAMQYEGMATKYLSEERINSVPSDTPLLQFDGSVMPGLRGGGIT